VISGSQTAIVVGKSGEEIWTDKYGRVKVQFHWDRVGEKDENSSCWVRISYPSAGKNWGWISLPRIDQEVIVSFLEGDPDKPMITGRVYNAEQMPPYDLPTNQTQSGIKTRSSKKGTAANYNEIRFEDKKGEEELYVHAEKDYSRVVENNDTLKVGFETKDSGDQAIDIYNNRTTTLEEGNDSLTVKKGNSETTVSKGNYSLKVEKGKRTVTVKDNDSTTISSGNHSIDVSSGNSSLKTSTTISQKAGTSTALEAGTTISQKAGTSMALEANTSMTLKAGVSIELKVGGNSIKIDNSGVTIKGIMVKVEGTAMAELKSPLSTVKGDGVLTLKGGITMIN
jgi:type VI secretion system secreted protein VgrG